MQSPRLSCAFASQACFRWLALGSRFSPVEQEVARLISLEGTR